MLYNQIQIQYLKEEDRLIVRLYAKEKQQARFLITRSFVKSSWPLVYEALAYNKELNVPSSMTAEKAVLDFKHEKIISNASIGSKKKAFREDDKSSPMITDVVSETQNKHPMLRFIAHNKVAFEICYDSKMIHYFYQALKNALKTAKWGLSIDINKVPKNYQQILKH